ncbi:hypothetical protein HG535_0C03130 [Zygotorulaspora mrakii]|uniref:Uncharacterized protein n=1 Tax=Zygotorulaspora mrakii TaxID=42260 RepID=A0A7H9B014_ZYGMR|nr:uncharacterized protein HG535_0C03130 [Zygotorulaspora mrakii]QLG71961.1 hypothetical protein HG535_0C03130 [Zygotorulaspora mrakii]
MKFGKTFPNHQVPEWSHQYVNYKSLKKLIKEISLAQGRLYAVEHDKDGDIGRDENSRKAINSSQVDETYFDHTDVRKLLASFFFALDRDIEKVNSFYNMQYLEYDRRLRRLTSSMQFNNINNFLNTYPGGFVASERQPRQPQTSTSNLRNEDSQNSTICQNMPLVSSHVHDVSESLEEVIGMLVELRSHFRNLKWYGELNKRAFTKILKKLDKKVGTNQKQSYLQARILPLSFSNDSEISRNLAIINEFLDKVSYKAGSDPVCNRENSVGENGLRTLSNAQDVVSMLIEKDDGKSLINELIGAYRSVVLIPTRILVNLLNKSALYQSFQCIDEILEIIPSLGDPNDINVRNFFHHHVIALGKNLTKDKRMNGKSTSSATEGNKEAAEYQKGQDDEEINNINSLMKKTLSFEAAAPPDRHVRLVGAFGPDGINSNDAPASLIYILRKLPAHLRPCLLQRDNYKRTPLHYSSQYGLVEITKIIIENLKTWGAWNSDVPIDDVSWQDSESLTPLHLAVLGTHPMTVKTLLSFMNPATSIITPQLLHLATRLNSPPLIEVLLSIKGININYQDKESCETALYLACKSNLKEAAATLLKNGASTEITERLFGWTPIFAAATEGLEEIVQLLCDYGAVSVVFDESGWTPMEHAALRGHLSIAGLLKIVDYPEITHPHIASANVKPLRPDSPISIPMTPTWSNDCDNTGTRGRSLVRSDSQLSIEHVSTNNQSTKISQRDLLKTSVTGNGFHNKSNPVSLPQPVKSFGHKYLAQNEAVLLITLGGNDSRSTKSSISLKNVPVSEVSSTELDTALSLVISCNDDLNETPIVLDLPLDSNLESINFKVPFQNDKTHIVYFDIVPTYGSVFLNQGPNSSSANEEQNLYSPYRNNSIYDSRSSLSSYNSNATDHKPSKVLGRAVALLGRTNASVGINRRSLNDMITVPIIANESLSVLGTITFEYMMVTPFDHPKMSLGRTETYWKSLVSTRVIGHRGLGKNFNSKNSLQLGENTVESFIAAASLGASYVEFDVQLTKDNIPVVYHDFLVAETGVDIPMHELTLEQFLHLNNVDNHIQSFHPNERRRSVDDSDSGIYNRSSDGKIRGNAYANVSKVLENRMKLTKTYKKNNFKGNSRGHSIASSFVTLKELFKKIPSNVGFNIECKYPMVDEAEKEDIGQIAVEMNHWIDTVLKVVYDNAAGRDIIFSSFHPDVCAMLSLKQPSIPILFLTEGGNQKMADIRASSLQHAIRFARSWNLLGIVSAASPIIRAPRLAQVIKSSGLVCVTFGTENNDPENANIEMDAGVDAVIVDSVLAVRQGLTKDAREDEKNIPNKI